MTSTIAPEVGTGPWREPIDAEAVLDNVRAILPLVDVEAGPSNAQGHLTSRLADALQATGAHRAGFARSRGGPEMSLTDQTRMVELIARHDASVAWNVTVLAATGFYAGRLDDRAFAELYPDLDRPTCGSFHPKGVARQVEGGYQVTGDWRFGSGIRSAHHVVGGVEVVDAEGQPVPGPTGARLTLGVWLPPEAIVLHDDWHVIGLRGSGSQGYAVQDAFVPAHHCFDRLFAPRADAEPLNKHVELPFYSMAGISVGIAQHALDLTVAELRGRTGARAPGERSLGLLGEADSLVRAARATVYAGVGAIDRAIFTPGELPDDRAMARGDSPMATELARTVLDRCADLCGARTIYADHPLEQLQRDLVGVSAHISTARSRWVDVGRMLLEAAPADVAR